MSEEVTTALFDLEGNRFAMLLTLCKRSACWVRRKKYQPIKEDRS
ncbi:hypothetical protein ACVWW5_004422 [Bradyrhizobium sp. LM3.4]